MACYGGNFTLDKLAPTGKKFFSFLPGVPLYTTASAQR
jgi:hypothetical protein